MGYKLTGMYIGSQKVRPSGWQPGANTIAYYPLTSTSTTDDESGNQNTLTTAGSVTFGTYGGVDCCYINVGMLSSSIPSTSKNAVTQNIWYCEAALPNNDNATLTNMTDQNPRTSGRINGMVRAEGYPDSKVGICGVVDAGSSAGTPAYSPVSTGTWYNCGYTYDGTTGTGTLYVNGQLVGTLTKSWSNNFTYVAISRGYSTDRSIKGYVSKAIFEDKIWTATEMLNYFNQTKANYGIS